MLLRVIGIALVLLLGAAPAAARDWFVRAGAEGGDGSLAKPFADPWQPLDKCEAGDKIHIAEGEYYGKLNSGFWGIPFDDISLIGGYDKDFKVRDPWKHHAKLTWKKEFKNYPKECRLLSSAKGTVIDGLVLDSQEKNEYVDDARTGRDGIKPRGEETIRCWLPCVVRNCVIINPGTYGIVCKQGSTIENNLILNAWGWGLEIQGMPPANELSKAVAQVKNNTILFCWDERAAGKGGYDGSAISLRQGAAARIENNILAYNDNHAVYCTSIAEKVALVKNAFAMNLFSNFKFYIEGRDIAIDNNSMGDLEDVGLKACEENEVVDPQLPLDPVWLDRYSKRTAAQPGKLVMDDWNKLRKEMGLTLIGEGGAPASGIAPAYDLAKALLLLQPKNADVKAGARVVPLEAKFAAEVAAGPAKTYPKANLVDWYQAPDAVDGKEFEMVVAISSVANVGGIPEKYKKDDHEGVFIHDPEGKGARITGFFKKGSSVARLADESVGRYNGNGVPDRLFLARGIAYSIKWVPKAAFFIESLEKYEAAAVASERPKGQDWFVRAGAAGGKGTREKPFKDMFQALEQCEAGDTVHVAEGMYTGKLKIGIWTVDTHHVTLLGGYDKDFKERDPWARPTYLYCPPDFKGRRGGYTIDAGENDTTGLVIDGFVFDKVVSNFYLENGDVIETAKCDDKEHIWISRPECVVRNCVFVNGAGAAIRGANGQLIENNIFMNHVTYVVRLSSGFTNQPAVIRNNTFLFSWERAGRFGKGRGHNGSFLTYESNVRSVVDGNIFEFADNDAIRIADTKETELTNNVFAHNLWSNVYLMQGTTFVDDGDFGKLGDLGWKKCEGNQVLSPGLPVDEKWFSRYLSRTAHVPGKVSMDDWNKIRELLGQPLIATGGTPASLIAPAYEWKNAMNLFPKNEACKAGARKRALEVKFEGIVRQAEKHEYEEVSWDVAKSKDEWAKYDGKRVMVKVGIKDVDNQFQLDDIKKTEYTAFQVVGPLGTDSGGLPMRCYVKIGTRHERAVRNAKGIVTSSKPEELHVVKGVARANRNLVVEVVERVE